MASLKLVGAIVLCMVVVAPMASEAVITSCFQVVGVIVPCMDYLKKGGDVPKACCDSVTKLTNDANTTPSRQKACQCLKDAASSPIGAGVNGSNAASLPGKCNVKLPFTITTSIDCKSIK